LCLLWCYPGLICCSSYIKGDLEGANAGRMCILQAQLQLRRLQPADDIHIQVRDLQAQLMLQQ
jgi:hypothetical protein